MRSIVAVITGGTRGIGRNLAHSFLAQGCSVVISGRKAEAVERACAELSARAGRAAIIGKACDAASFEQTRALWDFAVECMGQVDVWINNAGIGQPQKMLWDLDAALIDSLADTNYKGALFGCKIAASGMMTQESGGAIYNMEGLGSDGMSIKGMTAYGSSKRALSFITDSLARELKGTKVIVGGLQPGMVATEFITQHYKGKPEEWKKIERIFNIISDRPETVAPWLVHKILANKKNGARIKWLSTGKAAWRFITAPFVRRDIYGRLVVSQENLAE